MMGSMMAPVPEDGLVWPSRPASIASWPEIAAGGAAPPCCAPPHAQNNALRPSLLELQRASCGSDGVGEVAVGASLLGSTRRRRAEPSCWAHCLACALAALMIAIAGLLILTLIEHPLWSLDWSSPSSTAAWMLVAAAEAYGACLCLCSIVAASERPCVAFLWILVCLVVGTPAMCAYLLTRALRHGTVRLAATHTARATTRHIALPNQYC